EVDLARVGDARRQRVDGEALARRLEAHEGVRLRAADPDRVGAPVDVQGVGGLAAARLDRQVPGAEGARPRVEAAEDARAEAGDPESAPRVEAQPPRRR